MKTILSLTCLIAALLAVSPVQAEDTMLSVEINKGRMVKLDRPASSVVVADPTTADVQVVSPRLLVIHGKKIGETSLYAIDSQDNPILSAVVDVTHNISDLERTVHRVMPNADVNFSTVDGGLIMAGHAATVAESENIRTIAQAYLGEKDKMVNMIQTAGSDQVMLRVKIVEMKRNDLKNLGINLQSVVTSGNLGLQLLQGAPITFDSNGTLQRGASNSNTDLFGQYKHGGTTIGGVIDALETQGLATVLAEPNLTTTSGQPASFLAGGQFPIPVVQASSGSAPTITIQYQPFGVSLKFTPVVLARDRISLTVAPEVSTLDFSNPIQVSGVTYPILDTRQASAVVELGSGDSFMLAGLLQHETSDTVKKFPGLGDLPVLGTLFRSTSFQNNQTELAILVTPYIVHPVAEASKLQTPLDGYTPPSDLQMLLTGNLYQQEPMGDDEKGDTKSDDAKKPAAMPTLHGDGGFILDR